METRQILITGAAALLFAIVFFAGGRLHPLRRLFRNPHGAISFGAGISIAYVFVHLMPELHEVRSAFVEAMPVPLRFEGMSIYFVALLGFLAFYGLDHFRLRFLNSAAEGEDSPDFGIQIAGFVAYVGSMSYLLMNNIEDTSVGTFTYAVAISFHFLALDHSLQDDYGAKYERTGRVILGSAALLCWALGVFVALPKPAIAFLVAFISGAIVMNSSIMELQSKKVGGFVPFAAGGITYGLILMPLG